MAQLFHGVGHEGLVALDAEEEAAFLCVLDDVVADLLVDLGAPLFVGVELGMGLEGAVEALEGHEDPGDAAFEEGVAGVGVAVHDAVEHDAGEGL